MFGQKGSATRPEGLQEKMVIKDLLDKVSKPSDPDDPKVKQLRERLQKLQQSGEKKDGQQSQQAANPPKRAEDTSGPSRPEPKKRPGDAALEALADASDEERKQFAREQDPTLRVREERTHKLVAKQVNELIELTTEQEKRLKKLEQERQSAKRELEQVEHKNEEIVKKMKVIDQRLEKFMGLYEVITNQYNPFADEAQKQAMPPPQQEPTVPERDGKDRPSDAPGAVSLSDSLTGHEERVEYEQGTISSENQKKMQQLLAELQSDEWEKKDLDTDDEVDEVTVREEELLPTVKEELHTLLSGFEERLKQYVDESMETRLHETIAGLEDVLNDEIRAAVEERVSDLQGSDDIIEGALKELEELSAAEDEPALEEEVKAVEESVHELDDQIKAIPPSLYFRLQDGRVLKSKEDLVLALQTMPDHVFQHHVSDTHNHFADWLELALNDPQGQELRGASRQEMVRILQA